jgi:hypothetical protein
MSSETGVSLYLTVHGAGVVADPCRIAVFSIMAESMTYRAFDCLLPPVYSSESDGARPCFGRMMAKMLTRSYECGAGGGPSQCPASFLRLSTGTAPSFTEDTFCEGQQGLLQELARFAHGVTFHLIVTRLCIKDP